MPPRSPRRCALYSGSWALAPGLIGLYLINSQSMTPAYGIAGLASLTRFCLYLFLAKRAPKQEGPLSHQIGFFFLGRIFSPYVLMRIGIMSLLLGLQRLSGVASLIITHAAGGTVVDVGFMAGLVAFSEMPFMMMWGACVTALPKRLHPCRRDAHLLRLSGTVELCHGTWQIYALVLINACAVAAILSIPITYLQDLIADRPGLGSSLISVNVFVRNGVSASIFAAGTAFTRLFRHRAACRGRRSRLGRPAALSRQATGDKFSKPALGRGNAVGAAAGAKQDMLLALHPRLPRTARNVSSSERQKPAQAVAAAQIG